MAEGGFSTENEEVARIFAAAMLTAEWVRRAGAPPSSQAVAAAYQLIYVAVGNPETGE